MHHPYDTVLSAFSNLPHTMNPMKILGRMIREEEKETFANMDVIESRFTFELKEQTHRSAVILPVPIEKCRMVLPARSVGAPYAVSVQSSSFLIFVKNQIHLLQNVSHVRCDSFPLHFQQPDHRWEPEV